MEHTPPNICTHKHSHITFFSHESSEANWIMCQTDLEPIRALHAQQMAAADTETWANRALTACEVDKQLWTNPFLLMNILHWSWRWRRGGWRERLHVTLSFFFQMNLTAWGLVPGCVLVSNSNKNNINNINCSINVILVMYSVCF